MNAILKIYNKVRYQEAITVSDVENIKNDTNIHDFQRTSLLIQLYFKNNKSETEKVLLNFLLETQQFDVISLIQNEDYDDSWENTLLYKTSHAQELGKELMAKFISAYTSETVDLNVVSAWLMLVNLKGLSKDDTVLMTKAMMQPDDIIDYRDSFSKDSFFFRRYPTGGVSEKTALILPSLIAATAISFPVKSNFLVAKSLGYTGGTIDKLSSLKGFSAPDNPKRIVEILNNFGVVMSSTGNKIAYADNKMYTLRSLTGTIENIPLIVSSIGSKQLSIPSDYLLMDIRYGKSAFMKNISEASQLGDYLNEVLRGNNQPTNYLLTEADKPNGSTIGNLLEILESRDIMSNKMNNGIFEINGMKEQLDIVLKFYDNMMQEYMPKSSGYWYEYGYELIKKGTVLEKFFELLQYHGVLKEVIDELKNEYSLLKDKHVYELISDKNGTLNNIQYDNLGYFINYEINYDNRFDRPLLDGGGVILRVNLNDTVKEGETLAHVYSSYELSDEQLTELKNYFELN